MILDFIYDHLGSILLSVGIVILVVVSFALHEENAKEVAQNDRDYHAAMALATTRHDTLEVVLAFHMRAEQESRDNTNTVLAGEAAGMLAGSAALSAAAR